MASTKRPKHKKLSQKDLAKLSRRQGQRDKQIRATMANA